MSVLDKKNDVKREFLIKELKKISKKFYSFIKKNVEQLYQERQKESDNSYKSIEITRKISRLKKLQDSVYSVYELVSSKRIELLYKKNLMLLGEWGTGKTHLLCDVSKKKLEKNWPILLMLAKGFTEIEDPFLTYIQTKKLGQSTIDFLINLNSFAENKGVRALIIIDGVNEGNRPKWSKFLKKFIQIIDEHKNIALIVSCRAPFDQMMFTKKFRKEFLVTYHQGFSEIEFDAQLEFFSYYDISLPEIPLLVSEFSRPLFLKIFCESIKNLSETFQKKNWTEIINGQKSFNHILEAFIKKISVPLVEKHDFKNPRCYWIFVKNEIAKIMVKNARDYLYSVELFDLIKSNKDFSNKCVDEGEFIQEMVGVGILSEDFVYEKNKPILVYRLPYEKFSNHIISRHLLDNLDLSSSEKLKLAFCSGEKLGKHFIIGSRKISYASPSIAEALMLEFPIRVKNKKHIKFKELYFWLPEESQELEPLIDPFIEGLYWRPSEAFSENTVEIVNDILNKSNDWNRYKLLEALTTISTRAHHIWNAEKLYKSLLKMPMSDRDLFWNEYIRNAEKTQ